MKVITDKKSRKLKGNNKKVFTKLGFSDLQLYLYLYLYLNLLRVLIVPNEIRYANRVTWMRTLTWGAQGVVRYLRTLSAICICMVWFGIVWYDVYHTPQSLYTYVIHISWHLHSDSRWSNCINFCVRFRNQFRCCFSIWFADFMAVTRIEAGQLATQLTQRKRERERERQRRRRETAIIYQVWLSAVKRI